MQEESTMRVGERLKILNGNAPDVKMDREYQSEQSRIRRSNRLRESSSQVNSESAV